MNETNKNMATQEEIAAAWSAWQSRHGGKLGPGPAFVEAINAALALRLRTLDSLQRENAALKIDASKHAADAETVRREREVERRRAEAAEAEVKRLREALTPFAKFDLSELKQRAFLQILVCPEGDDHADNYAPHFIRARSALASTGGEHNGN